MQREEVTFVMLRDRSARARVCMRERMSQLQNNTCFCLYDLPCEMRATLRPLRYLFRRNPRAIVASAMLHALHDLSHRLRPACSLPRRPRSSSGRRREAAVLRGERRGRGGGLATGVRPSRKRADFRSSCGSAHVCACAKHLLPAHMYSACDVHISSRPREARFARPPATILLSPPTPENALAFSQYTTRPYLCPPTKVPINAV